MVYRFADFELDTDQSRLTRGGKEISLQPKVFEALLLLARTHGQLVTKQEMMDALWPETYVNEEALAQVIFKLRRALGDTREEPRFIQTVLKRGFRFLPEVLNDSVDGDDQARSPLPGVKGLDGGIADERSGLPGRLEDEGIEPQAPSTTPAAMKAIAPAGAPEGAAKRRSWPLKLALGSIALVLIMGSALVIRQRLKPDRPTASPSVPDVRNQKVRRLTFFPERDQDADIAPDGKSFVFISKHGGDGLFKLYWMSTAGGNPVRLTRSKVEEQTPRLSPTGDWIVYRRNEDDGSGYNVWRVRATGGEESLVAVNAALPDWSPDGREILFVRALASGEVALMRMSLEDGIERQILSQAELIDMPAWSPDGGRIAFVTREAVWVVPAQGGEPQRVTERDVTVQTLTWAPDSKAIICDATWGGRRNLWMLPLEGDGAPVPITAGSGVDIYPSITPDWRYLLYSHEQWQRLVWVVDKAGRHPVNIQAKTTFESVSIDSNGEWLAYSDYEPSDRELLPTGNGMGVLNIKTLEQRQLGSGYLPVFDYDAKRLAFLRDTKEGGELHIMEIATGASRRVTQTPALKVEPAWSRDGTRLVFHRADTAHNPGLTIVELASGRETLLAEGNYASPAWSPDGQWIAAAGMGSGGRGLYLFDVANLQAKRISETCSYEAAPIWSSDSRSLQILVDERTRSALITLSLEGVQSSRLDLEFNRDPSFWGIFLVKATPNGYVYLLQRVEGDIYMAENPSHDR